MTKPAPAPQPAPSAAAFRCYCAQPCQHTTPSVPGWAIPALHAEPALNPSAGTTVTLGGEPAPSAAATITALRAEVERLRAERQWRPIETAPRGSGEDGPNSVTHPDYVPPPHLLLQHADGISVGYYDWYYHPGYGRGASPDEPAWRSCPDYSGLYGVTHWMPLPDTPSGEETPR